jgi:uncharacterized protein
MKMIVVLFAIIFVGCAGKTKNLNFLKTVEQHEASEPKVSWRVIDAHLHTRLDSKKDFDTFIAALQSAGVSGGIAHTGENGKRGYLDLRKHGILHCFGIGEQFKKAEERILEDGLSSRKFSCIKIYLGYIDRYASDPFYQPAYRLAAKYRVPIVFHTGDTLDRDGKVKYADPLTIDEIAVDHRNINFLIAHCGNPWIQSAAEVAYKNPNVYLDGSALLIGDLSKMSEEQLDQYVVQPLKWVFGYVEDPTKLLFGSDWPLTPIHQYLEVFKKAIPKEHWKAVFHDNALRLFPELEQIERR